MVFNVKSNKSLRDGPVSSSPSVGTSQNQQPTGPKRLPKYMMIVAMVGFVLAAFETLLAPSEFYFGGSVNRPPLSIKELALQDFRGQKGVTQESPLRIQLAKQQLKRQTTKSHNQDSKIPITTTTSPPPPYHVVFSTSCTDQMNWESYVLYYHAHKVNQPGTVTRIASGCGVKEGMALQTFHDKYIGPMNPGKFLLHLTPDYGSLTVERKLGDGRNYKYMNKPYGFRHWMEKVLRMNETDRKSDVDDGIVIMLDPDMILLRPILHDFTNEDVIFVKGDPDTKVVKHGYPMAQQDGYLENVWMNLNTSYVTNGGNINHLNANDGPIYYNTGPPYLATVRDAYKIALLWCEYAPRGTYNLITPCQYLW
jgi:hypothetical protein